MGRHKDGLLFGSAYLLERIVSMQTHLDGSVTVNLRAQADKYTRVRLRKLFPKKDVFIKKLPGDKRGEFAALSMSHILEVLLPMLNIAYSRNASHTSSADLGVKDSAKGLRYMWGFREALGKSGDAEMAAGLEAAAAAFDEELIAHPDEEWRAWIAWARKLFERIPFGGAGGECWFRVSNCDAIQESGFVTAVLGLYALFMPSLPRAVALVRAARVSNYTCRAERLAALECVCEALCAAGVAAAAGEPPCPFEVMLGQLQLQHDHLSVAPCLGKHILRATFLHRDRQIDRGLDQSCLWRISISGGVRCLELLLVLEPQAGEAGTKTCRCWQVLIPLAVGEAVWTSFPFNTGQGVAVHIGGVDYTVRGCHCNLGVELPEVDKDGTFTASGDSPGAWYTVYLRDADDADRQVGVHLSGFFTYPEGVAHALSCVNLLADMVLRGVGEKGEAVGVVTEEDESEADDAMVIGEADEEGEALGEGEEDDVSELDWSDESDEGETSFDSDEAVPTFARPRDDVNEDELY